MHADTIVSTNTGAIQLCVAATQRIFIYNIL